MISTNQFKNGTHIEVDGTIFRIVEFQHVKPGKGGAFVRSKLKRVDDGAAWHDNQLAREDDAERQALLEAAGERVLRVRWEQSVCRETQTLRRFRAAGAPSG